MKTKWGFKIDSRSRVFYNLGRVRGSILVGKTDEALKLLSLIEKELSRYKFLPF